MYQECQSFDYNNVQFWLNDQYTATEPLLMLQYPHNLLLTESYQPVEQQELQGNHYSNIQHHQFPQQQQQQQDLFYVGDFDYLYTPEDCMVSSNGSGPSSPSYSLSSSTFFPLNEFPYVPENEQNQVFFNSMNLPQEPEMNSKATIKSFTNSNETTRKTHSNSKKNPKNYDRYCHQSLVLTPASQENKPFACHLCPRKFARKHDLQRHIRVHTCAKPYSCLSCTKSFARTDALKRHLRMEEKCRLSPIIQAMKEKGCRRYRNL